MKTIIQQNERGLLYKNGKFIKVLQPGKYSEPRLWGRYIEVVEIHEAIYGDRIDYCNLLKNASFADAVVNFVIEDGQVGVLFLNGRLYAVLHPGDNFYFKDLGQLVVKTFDLTNLKIEGLTYSQQRELPENTYYKYVVGNGHIGLLMIDGVLIEELPPGTHYYWQVDGYNVSCNIVDLRIQDLDINSQEILTADKVAVRINFTSSFKVVDAVKIHNEIKKFKEQLYSLTQLVIREYIGKFTFDELLDQKEALSTGILALLQTRSKMLYVEFMACGILDIILPGEVRSIMNTVLIAKKQAEANVITRREETASTRSLLNTAKLLDENATLYKLKELEHIERIALNVSNISVGGGNLLSELKKVVSKE